MVNQSKRRFLKQGLKGLSVCGIGAVWSNLLVGCSHVSSASSSKGLQPADENGVRLPEGLHSRVIAVSSQPVIEKSYTWHAAPDGGACFATDDGGWIYVSNSEMSDSGGVGAIVFDRSGTVIDAYPILENTRRNCAGGATPWGSWLSCEEVKNGQVWECYPDGKTPAVLRPALGTFAHEAIAVDEKSLQLYLTEDMPDGSLYRFTATDVTTNNMTGKAYPDLSEGKLEVATAKNRMPDAGYQLQPDQAVELEWLEISDPGAELKATRYQQALAMKFNGGEGIAYFDDKVVFTTKGDNRVWSYNTSDQLLNIIYDEKNSLTPILTGVDNITVSQNGDIYVAEDGGDLQIVVIDQQGRLYPVAQLQGHDRSEVTGIAFSPDGSRLYFSSQRGVSGLSEDGVTFEIRGF